MQKKLTLTIALTSILIAGCAPTPSITPNPPIQEQNQITENNTLMEPKPESTTPVTPINTEKPLELLTDMQYLDYTPELYNSLLGKKPFALFFHADWCPTCRKIETEVNQNLTKFPLGTVILKANYDQETELKKKYGITSQSIIVVIDEKGTVLEKLAAPTTQKLQETIQKSL